MKNPKTAKRMIETKRQNRVVGKYKEADLKFAEASKKRLGRKSPVWKGGRYNRMGYPMIQLNHARQRKNLHVAMMEYHLGRCLRDKETVHHIDGDKNNFRFDNLFLCKSQAHHNKLHGTIVALLPELMKNKSIKFNKQAGVYELCPTNS